MLWFLLAGNVFLSPVSSETKTDLINHTLNGETVRAEQVVCRNRWGTPMLPDGKGGYSLIAPINNEFIARSLTQPPRTDGPIFRPAPAAVPKQQ
jgi:hypothetical protein